MNPETIKDDLEDLQKTLSLMGKVTGCIKVFNVNDVASNIINEFSNELKSAKGIWIEFEILPTISALTMSDIMDIISNYANVNSEAIFKTAINKDISENNVKCKILFTGLA